MNFEKHKWLKTRPPEPPQPQIKQLPIELVTKEETGRILHKDNSGRYNYLGNSSQNNKAMYEKQNYLSKKTMTREN